MIRLQRERHYVASDVKYYSALKTTQIGINVHFSLVKSSLLQLKANKHLTFGYFCTKKRAILSFSFLTSCQCASVRRGLMLPRPSQLTLHCLVTNWLQERMQCDRGNTQPATDIPDQD